MSGAEPSLLLGALGLRKSAKRNLALAVLALALALKLTLTPALTLTLTHRSAPPHEDRHPSDLLARSERSPPARSPCRYRACATSYRTSMPSTAALLTQFTMGLACDHRTHQPHRGL